MLNELLNLVRRNSQILKIMVTFIHASSAMEHSHPWCSSMTLLLSRLRKNELDAIDISPPTLFKLLDKLMSIPTSSMHKNNDFIILASTDRFNGHSIYLEGVVLICQHR